MEVLREQAGLTYAPAVWAEEKQLVLRLWTRPGAGAVALAGVEHVLDSLVALPDPLASASALVELQGRGRLSPHLLLMVAGEHPVPPTAPVEAASVTAGLKQCREEGISVIAGPRSLEEATLGLQGRSLPTLDATELRLLFNSLLNSPG
jgi:hypothetical protein